MMHIFQNVKGFLECLRELKKVFLKLWNWIQTWQRSHSIRHLSSPLFLFWEISQINAIGWWDEMHSKWKVKRKWRGLGKERLPDERTLIPWKYPPLRSRCMEAPEALHTASERMEEWSDTWSVQEINKNLAGGRQCQGGSCSSDRTKPALVNRLLCLLISGGGNVIQGIIWRVDKFNKPDNRAECSLHLFKIPSCVVTGRTAGTFSCKWAL